MSEQSSMTLMASAPMPGSEFRVTYDKSRFPKQPKLADGSWGCRGCGGALPKHRKAWCSKACVDRYHPTHVIWAVKKRDKDVCAMCGYDCRAEREKWVAACHAVNISTQSYAALDRLRASKIKKPEYDHILSMADGGLTVVENMRTLCADCHKRRTKDWHRERVVKRDPQQRFALDTPNDQLNPRD